LILKGLILNQAFFLTSAGCVLGYAYHKKLLLSTMIEKFSITKYGHWFWKSFCIVFFDKQNLKRDVKILSAVIILLVLLFNVDQLDKLNRFKMPKFGQVAGESVAVAPNFSEEQVQAEVKVIQESIDTSSWKTYQSRWYGVEIKYPEQWLIPVYKSAIRESKWEYRSQFRKKDVATDNQYLGFDLIIYSIPIVKEATSTDEFPKLKNADLQNNEDCAIIYGHLIETGDYPAEEIYIPPTDDCYNPVLYFTYTRGQYIYNIIPVMREDYDRTSDPMVDIADHFSEFFSVAAEMKIIDIVRPKPKPIVASIQAKRPMNIGAPMPYIYKVVNGRRICSNKNDNPSKSKKNKGRHMDMECCLDPDEYPNPNCYYSPGKYGKYL